MQTQPWVLLAAVAEMTRPPPGNAPNASGGPGAAAGVIATLPIALGLIGAVLDSPPGTATAELAALEEAGRFESGRLVEDVTPQGYMNIFFGNLHSHTSYSDGKETPAQAFAHARTEGELDFIAVTEHNHARAGDIAGDHTLYSGSRADSLISTANRLTENGKFVALYGQEFSAISKGNHMNVLDVPAVIDVENGQFDRLLQDWLPANLDTSGETGILLLNHPATTSSKTALEYGRDDFASDEEWIRALDPRAHLINIINGPSHSSGVNLPPSKPSESEFFRYLNLGFHLAPTADQDNHQRTWGTITRARVAVLAEQLTKPALLDAMRKRHVYATTDRNLRVIARINGHFYGDVIADVPVEGDEFDIKLVIHDDDEPFAQYEVEVFSDHIGGPKLKPSQPNDVVSAAGNQPLDDPLIIEDIVYTGPGQYILFRIEQLDEHGNSDRVWTAPVWLQPNAEESITPLEPDPDEPDQPDLSRIVASRRSSIFHESLDCLDAQRIKQSNRVTGQAALSDRQLHNGCPRTAR